MAGLSHRGGSYDLLQDQERMLSLSSCLVGAGRMWPLMGKQVFRPIFGKSLLCPVIQTVLAAEIRDTAFCRDSGASEEC